MPPKQDARQFHWIHKDTDSLRLSGSDGEEATNILRFVQQNRPTISRRRRPLSRSAHHDFVAFRTESTPSTSHNSEDKHESDKLSSRKRPKSMSALQSRWRLGVPINNATSGSGVDPFESAVVPISSSMWSLLQYTKTSLLNGAGGYKLELFNDDMKPMMEMYHAAIKYTFRDLIHYKHILFPVLAAFSRRVQRLSSTAFGEDQNPDHYAGLATRAVRTSLAENAQDRQIMSSVATGVHFLICAAGLAGQPEETDIHIRAFLRFLPFVNTKTLLGQWELDVANSWDIINAVASGRAPIMQTATIDPDSMLPSRLRLLHQELQLAQSRMRSLVTDHAAIYRYQARFIHNKYDLMQYPAEDLDLSLGTGLEEAMEAGIIHPQMQGVVRNTLDCLTVAKVIWQIPELATKEDANWLCRKSRATLHELLSMTDAKQIDHSTHLGRLAECLRRTLIIVLMSAQYRVTYMFRQQLAVRLQEALLQILMHEQQQSEASPASIDSVTTPPANIMNDLLLWMLFTGYWAALKTFDSDWFAQKAIEVAVEKLKLRSFHDLDAVMTRYLYARTVQHDALRSLATLLYQHISVEGREKDNTGI